MNLCCLFDKVNHIPPVAWLSAPRTDAGNFDEYCSNGELAVDDK